MSSGRQNRPNPPTGSDGQNRPDPPTGSDGQNRPNPPTGSSIEAVPSAGSQWSATGGLEERADSPSGPISRAEPYRDIIVAGPDRGLSAQRILQDLVNEQGFTGGYDSVKRFCRRLRQSTPLPFRRIECLPGEEAQIDFGTGAPIVVEPRGTSTRTAGPSRGPGLRSADALDRLGSAVDPSARHRGCSRSDGIAQPGQTASGRSNRTGLRHRDDARGISVADDPTIAQTTG
jgi:hypothetical protein